MKNKKTLFIGILLGIFLVFLVISGIIAYNYNKNKIDAEVIKVSSEVIPPANAENAVEVSENSSYEESDESNDNEYEEYRNRKFIDEAFSYAEEAAFLIYDYEEEKQETFYANNLKEFLNVLGNNRIIYVNNSINISEELSNITSLQNYTIQENTGIYDNTFSLKYGNEYYELSTKAFSDKTELKSKQLSNFVNTPQENAFTTNDISLTIKNVTNLSIIGNSETKKNIQIISQNNNTPALFLNNTTDVALKNLTLRHNQYIETTDKYYNHCALQIFNSKLIALNNCTLTEGTEAIFACDVDFLSLVNCTITNCTSSALNFVRVYNSYLESSYIKNNINLFNIFYFFESNIDIYKGIIKNNNAENFIQLNGMFNRLNFNNECDIKENQFKNWMINHKAGSQIRIDSLFSIPNIKDNILFQ